MTPYLKILLYLLLASCSTFNSKQYKPSEKQILANKIRSEVAKKISTNSGLHPCGTGGQMMNEIKMLALSFDYYKPIEIQEARQLLINATDCLVDAVNQNQQIRPYLFNYPFKPGNIEIRIFLHNADGSEVAPDKLSIVSMIEGVLNYKIDDPKGGLFETVLRENYEEAIERLKETKTL